MEHSGRYSELLAALGESICSESGVEFAVAFGSWTTGQATSASDIDIAVKFSDSLSDRERFERQCFLSGYLQREDAPFVDVPDIESLPVDVAHDAVNGTLICGDEEAFEQFETATEAAFTRQEEEIRRQQRAVIDRIAGDGLRG